MDVGIWDVFFAGLRNSDKLRCLVSCSETFDLSHLHYSHFILAVEEEGLTPVGSCSRFVAPVSAQETYKGLKTVTAKLLDWSEQQHADAFARLNFLRDPAFWPDLPMYAGTCFLETVYTEEAHRGKGIASSLLNKCIKDGHGLGAKRNFLLADICNDAAIRIYTKAGLQTVAQLLHADCQSALGLPGFDIMVREN